MDIGLLASLASEHGERAEVPLPLDTDRDGRIDGEHLLLDVVGGVRRVRVAEDDGADDAADVLVGPHAQEDALRSSTTFWSQICNQSQS